MAPPHFPLSSTRADLSIEALGRHLLAKAQRCKAGCSTLFAAQSINVSGMEMRDQMQGSCQP